MINAINPGIVPPWLHPDTPRAWHWDCEERDWDSIKPPANPNERDEHGS